MVASCAMVPVCARVASQRGRLDLKDGRGVTVFFVLGFLDEYLGRHIVEGDDLVEGFSCNETEKVPAFRRQLERLARERPTTLACMHGSAWHGNGANLLRALAAALTSKRAAA